MDLIHEIQDEELHGRHCMEFLEELEYVIGREIEEGQWPERFEES